MALYYYQAFSRDGKRMSGSLDAGSIQAVKEHLSKQGLFPIRIDLATTKPVGAAGLWQRFFGPRVSLKDKIFFTKQLAVLLRAGVPLLESLELLIEQTEKSLRSIVVSLKDAIKEGQSLADSLAQYPRIFDTTYVQLVRAGEASGNLERILDRLVEFLEQSQDLRKRVSKAVRMPLLQLGAIVVIVAILLTAVVPNIASVFEGQNVQLPLPTRVLMGLSTFLLEHYLIVLITFITLVGGFLWWKSTPSGARMWDALLLKLPVIGYFSRAQAIVQFSRTLGILLEGRVNLPEALTIVCNVVDNKVLSEALLTARENIIKEGKITEYLKQTGLFPPVAIYLINTGEKSGQLDQMLLTVAGYYEGELRDAIERFSTTLNAAMPLVMGLIVGFVVYAIAKPIMTIGEVVKRA